MLLVCRHDELLQEIACIAAQRTAAATQVAATTTADGAVNGTAVAAAVRAAAANPVTASDEATCVTSCGLVGV
jgi:hypothetical protein